MVFGMLHTVCKALGFLVFVGGRSALVERQIQGVNFAVNANLARRILFLIFAATCFRRF